MRCITTALLLLPLLHASAAATTSPSATTAYNGTASDTSSPPSLSGNASTVTTSTTRISPSVSSSSASSASKKHAHDSPLVFLPQSSPSLCPSRTVNYITHSLPQQCLRTSRSAPGNGTLVEGRGGNGTVVVNGTTVVKEIKVTDEAATNLKEGSTSAAAKDTAAVPGDAIKTGSLEDSSKLGVEDGHDSPLDDSKFLSFEEWKKQNLAKVGQSPENVGQGRPQGGEARQRPINNALDTLGEEGEIELDFTGFGDGSSRYTPDPATAATQAAAAPEPEESTPASTAKHRSNDAGKTCKERFNYASFDCAATVMKTNPQCKSFQSVLVENKDSYMLNECSAENKFIIIELCDDILVDTVVVANFEFFSSMFRTFRVSVSDRYPVKGDRWKDLGTFEARNTREIQAFLVENPLIWARYLRIEFLTHYGSEFYCPVSLVRVHGTTMMEEFRHQEDAARGEEDGVEELVADVEPETQISVPVEVTDTGSEPVVTTSEHLAEKRSESPPTTSETGDAVTVSPEAMSNLTMTPTDMPAMVGNSTSKPVAESPNTSEQCETRSTTTVSSTKGEVTSSASQAKDDRASSDTNTTVEPQTKPGNTESRVTSVTTAPNSTAAAASSKSVTTAAVSGSTTTVVSNTTASISGKQSHNTTTITPKSDGKSNSSVTTANTGKPSKTAGTESTKNQHAPPPPQPSTQDSFFKTTNKRLTMLETNSSLNIQYIEEQSRILRDAFMQTEKHQLKKTENFLKHLNDTVLAELKGFRTQYDQLWQSTVIELEESRARSQMEMMAFSTRLTMLADELVWAKRMNVVQSILLLLSLGLFVFASKGKEYMDMPIMQQALKRSQSVLLFRGNGSFDSPSPPGSPTSPRASSPKSRHNLRLLSTVTSPDPETRPGSPASDIISPLMDKGIRPDDAYPATPVGKLANPGLHFEPPTPDTSIDGRSERARSASPTLSPQHTTKPISIDPHSGPAMPIGAREIRSPDSEGSSADERDSPLLSTASIVMPTEALSPFRVRNKAPPSTGDRRPSPLRYSESDELDVGDGPGDVLPSIEGDAASAGIEIDVNGDRCHDPDANMFSGFDRMRKDSGGGGLDHRSGSIGEDPAAAAAARSETAATAVAMEGAHG